MLDSFKERNFANCCRWDTVIFLLQSDLLQSYKVAGHQIFALVNDTVSALAKFFETLVTIELLCIIAELLLLGVVLLGVLLLEMTVLS